MKPSKASEGILGPKITTPSLRERLQGIEAFYQKVLIQCGLRPECNAINDSYNAFLKKSRGIILLVITFF